MTIQSLNRNDAIRMLEDGKPHNIKLWKLSTGDILEYSGAICLSGHRQGGTHNVQLPRSRQIRKFRDVSLFEIDNLKIFW